MFVLPYKNFIKYWWLSEVEALVIIKGIGFDFAQPPTNFYTLLKKVVLKKGAFYNKNL